MKPSTLPTMQRVALLLLTAASLLAISCARHDPLNVLVVTLDTTRADRIGCYGDQGASTPTLDALAAEGILFEEAIAPVPITLPSHSSLMTGKLPPGHGVRDNGLFILGDEQTTLAELLRDHGYRTAAGIGAFPLTAQFGIDQGFELYDDHVSVQYEDLFGDRVFPKERLFFDERRAARVNDAVVPWLEEHADEPFFLWVHYFDPHQPLEPPPPFDQTFAHDLYAGEIAYADESLGTLLGHLERLGVADETIIVVTADHGEGLGEHNEWTHSLLAYQSTLHVPLIVRAPDGPRGVRIAERVSLVDVAPTLLDLLDLEPLDGFHGQSLTPLITASQRGLDRALYAETLSASLTRGWGELRALYRGPYKYIHGPRPELYNLDDDPGELDDLIDAEPVVANEMHAELERLLPSIDASVDASVTVDDTTARRLAALGYVGAAGNARGPIEERLRTDGDPPQDHAGEVSAYSQARAHLFANRPVEARELIGDLLRSDPDNPEYLELQANAGLALGETAAALEILRRLSDPDAGHSAPERMGSALADLLLRQGQLEEAYQALERAQAIRATAGGQYRLAKLHELRGDSAEQQQALLRAIELEADHAPALTDLGIWYAQRDRATEAEKRFRHAMTSNPYHPRVCYNLAVFLVDQQRPTEALTVLERAVELDPHYVQAHAALVELAVLTGDLETAEDACRALEELVPNSPAARDARTILEGLS